MRRRSRAALLSVLVVVAVIWLAAPGLRAAPAQQAGAQPPPASETKPATYAGSEACQACHEDIYNAFQKNPHSVVGTEKARGWEGKACESCHGPGSIHAESAAAADIKNPAKLPVTETDQTCSKCHLGRFSRIGRQENGHGRNQVSCSGCHTVHQTPEQLVPRKPASINTLCSSCHTSEWAQFLRPYKHRLPEGAMSCADCHEPHGAFQTHSVRTYAANEAACFRCHGDKRGPFTFEHAPVRFEGCATCHEPHGSANPRMLARQEVRFVCLECHANLPTPQAAGAGPVLGVVPPAFHDLRSPRFRNCTICHQKIHGSYVNRMFLR